MHSKRFISVLILTAIIASTFSCGESGEALPTDSTDTSSEETTVGKAEYEFPELNCDGAEFTLLGLDVVWDMYTHLDFDTQTGEALDDAVYNRNRSVEEKFNFKLVTHETANIDDLAGLVKTAVMAGDDIYDAAYIKGNDVGSVITDGYLTDLTTIDSLRLDEPWWNQNVRTASALGKKGAEYFAVSDLSLTGFDLTWCLMFNETMCGNLKLDKPYDLVRNGKWTLDALHTYTKAGANLNGDESFTYNANGKAVYGLTSYNNIVTMFLVGANCHLTESKDGIPYLSLESERFYEFCDKCAELCKTEGEYLEANDSSKHYEKIFKSGRALFVGAEIKASSVFRDYDDTFGILPAPKLDEAQESYQSWINFMVPLLTVPKTTNDPERAGIILDALSYLSTKDVLPIYYNVTVSQKGLRNDDSIEMLGIIRDARYFEPSISYGWTNSVYGSIKTSILEGNGSVASIIAANKDSIKEKIDATLSIVG